MTGNDVEYTYGTSGNETGRFLFWTEDCYGCEHQLCLSTVVSNRMHAAVDEKYSSYYAYDHSGSASWISDNVGLAVQHLQYLPYGERYVDQRAAGYHERFTFTGKENDEETGYGYFGARYMDHELMTMWLSVDPMADKYPSISPYAYCAWNPVKLVDPDGRKIKGVKYNKKTGEITYRRYAQKNGTNRYIEARMKTTSGRAGIQAMINSKRKFDIRVTDLPLFIESNQKKYGQLNGITIEDDLGMKTIIIVSTATKTDGNCWGIVVSNNKVKGEEFITDQDVSHRANPSQYKLMEDMGMSEFEDEHPYESDIQRIHGIGAHEEEHALRGIPDAELEERNAISTEKKERLEYINETFGN